MIKHKVLAVVEARVVTGPAKNILRFATANRHRVEIGFVTFVRQADGAKGGQENNLFVSTAQSLGLSVKTIREAGPLDSSARAALKHICAQEAPDIVQTHGIKSHFFLSLLRERPFRWVAFHHGYTNENFKMRIYNQFDRWSLRRSDLVVTVCSEFSRRLQHRGVRKEQIVIVPNSIPENFDRSNTDRECRAQTRANFGIAADESLLISVGRLSKEKGHRYLIDAMSHIRSLAPQLRIQLLIAGAGPSESELERQIRRLNLSQNVRILGYLPDVKPLFSIADLFVLPSLSEGCPNVLLESIATRVPIVASRVGGVPELVRDAESALLVPPANAEALAESVGKLLFDRVKAEQLADTAFDTARRQFAPELYDQNVLNVYAQATRRARSPMGDAHLCVD
jgi:glycosyltransferase involved in cell wall biosynthesis